MISCPTAVKCGACVLHFLAGGFPKSLSSPSTRLGPNETWAYLWLPVMPMNSSCHWRTFRMESSHACKASKICRRFRRRNFDSIFCVASLLMSSWPPSTGVTRQSVCFRANIPCNIFIVSKKISTLPDSLFHKLNVHRRKTIFSITKVRHPRGEDKSM